jgi:hypothetical protein
MRSDPFAVRVTDYKTGTPPKNAARIVIGGGAELQRALYALACRQLLDEEPRVFGCFTLRESRSRSDCRM